MSNTDRSSLLYQAEKPCCTTCDKRKVCHVCGAATLFACSDCRIDFQVSVYVCATATCRDAHEQKCSARVRNHGETLLQEIERLQGTVPIPATVTSDPNRSYEVRGLNADGTAALFCLSCRHRYPAHGDDCGSEPHMLVTIAWAEHQKQRAEAAEATLQSQRERIEELERQLAARIT